MASILGQFEKQSAEILDYDVDYSQWFEGRTCTPESIEVDVDDGITFVRSAISGFFAKVVLAGGVSGSRYKVTVRMTTSDGLVKEADFVVSVKDV